MHPAACLGAFSILSVFPVARTASVPSPIVSRDLTSPPLHGGKDSGCPSNDASCSSVLQPQLFPRSIHCQVPGTDTVLLIEQAWSQPIFPYRMAQVLLQTQKYIRQKLARGGDRPLYVSEVPFSSVAWGLQFEAIPAPQAPGERPAHIGLTWQMLNETIEGLFACVVARKEYFVLRAIITSEVGVTLDHMGDLTLGYAKRPVDTA